MREQTVRRGKRRARAVPGRTRLATDERRAQLLSLGLATFGTRPYDDVSIEEIAQEAGVSRALVFHHFPTKRDFYVATLREAARQLLEALDLPDSMEPLARLTEGLSRWLTFAEHRGAAYAALTLGGIGADAEVRAIVEGTRGTIIERFVRDMGHEAPSPLLRTTLRGWVGLVEATSLDWLAHERDVPRHRLLALWQASLLALVPHVTVEDSP